MGSRESADIAKEVFEQEDQIFANKQLLSIGHVPEPDRIVGRDDEIRDLAEQLRGAIEGYSPDNVIVYGKTGTGKSLVSKYVMGRAQDLSESDIAVGTAYLDCSEDNTETQAVSSLAKTLNDEAETDISVPQTGLSTSKYYKRLWQILDRRYDVMMVILDEVDLMADDDLLMKLSRAEEANKVDCHIGVIAISNKIQYAENLNERVKSSLQHKELFFQPYDATQLREIMRNRADAFQEGVLTDDVIPLCAAFAAQEHGDARKAIDILRHAGKIAYKNGSDVVTEEHVRDAQQLAEKDRFRELIDGAPTQAKTALLALAELSLNNDTEAFPTREVFKQYRVICEAIDMDTLSERRFRDILKEQAFLGIVDVEKLNQGLAGGVTLKNRLIEDPDIVREILLEDTRMSQWADDEGE
ncbi:AAA family ATPase [Halostella sp. JP-L12]|uniref:Cdc6/Cdc18 family protein n=1 Tax=Halostella TaxID=1843185 RepID=UPI000EF76934|nr:MULTISPECIES: orc1/cdc6 family replication initiation protein [Halostella]NHN48695.1 AAA family ATPase [Halostella sp. JP-L12]